MVGVMIEILLNELPKLNNRIIDLINSKSNRQSPRTHQDIDREFNVESWGKLLADVRKSNPTSIGEIDDLYCAPEEELVISIEDKLFLTNQKYAYDKFIEVLAHNLLRVNGNPGHFVEMGCGYGSKIFNLMQSPDFEQKTFSATEITENGKRLTSLISELLGYDIVVGHVDFDTRMADVQTVPEDSVIFTSYALHYANNLDIDFWTFIDSFKPKAVVAFEPCYELYGTETLLGLLRGKYHRENCYTKNIVSSLREFCDIKNKHLQILPNIFGLNPLLPISVLIYERDY